MKIEEIEALNHRNILYLPDKQMVYPLPWAIADDCKVGEVLCEAYCLDNRVPKVPLPFSSRTIARKQLQRLRDEGYTFLSAFEMEFLLEDIATGKKIKH